MGLISWCNRFIKTGYYLLFGLVPLLLTPWNYELFEYNKMMAVYTVTSLIVTSWIVKMLAQKEIKIAKTPLDIPIALFVTSQLVSSLFSMDPHVSWFGYYSRFNGGMWSIISYVLLYYAYMSTMTNKNDTTYLLKTSLVTATLVALYGVLERMGIDKHLWVQDVQNRVFSTLGQPNWLAAYLVALIPLAWTFILKKINIKTVLFSLLSTLFFVTLLFTRSRSGLLGLVVADIVFWGILILSSPRTRGSRDNKNWIPDQVGNDIWKPVVLIHALFALMIFFNGSGVDQIDRYVSLKGIANFIRPGLTSQGQALPKTSGPALETGGTESGTIRKYVWEGAINAWKSSPKTMLIGTGTETFAFAFYQFRPVAHNNTSEWDFLYNKAHNEYLNYLATTGAFGLGSYLFFIGTFIIWFVKQVKKTDNIRLALFSGWISVLVTNFFGFSVVITQIFLFLFPALIFVTHEASKLRSISIRSPRWTAWIPVALGLYLLVKIGSFWYADKLFAFAYQYDRAGLYAQASPSLLSAIAINPNEPLYHDELAGLYAALSANAFTSKNATQAAQLAQHALVESHRATSISPNNVNFLKSRTKVYYTLSTLDPSFNGQALQTLLAAAKLSPNDPKIYYNLAILSARDAKGDPIAHLRKAKELKPDYRDAYNALNIFYTEMKKPNEARAILEEYLTKINPNDKDFLEKIK